MSNTHIIRFASRACVVAGMVMLVVAVMQVPYAQQLAQLSQHGAIQVPQNVQLEAASDLSGTIKPAPSMHAAAPVSNLSSQMIVGALLLFAGLGFHMLWVIRRSGEQPVPVHAAKRREKRPATKKSRAYWLYVQLR